MSYLNRRGRIGRSIGQRFNALPQRRRINSYNPSVNHIRRGRIQATKPHSFSSIPRNLLLGHGPIEGITWKDFAKHELNGITSGALAGWRKDEGDWKMRFRNAVWGGLRGGLKVVADDAYEYAKDRWSKRRWWPDNWLERSADDYDDGDDDVI